MLSRKPRAPITLHQPGRTMPIGVDCGTDADVAGRLLHDGAEDDALVDSLGLGTFFYGIPDAANVFARVAGLRHLVLVRVEDGLEGLPLVLARELVGWAGEVLETHCDKNWGKLFEKVELVMLDEKGLWLCLLVELMMLDECSYGNERWQGLPSYTYVEAWFTYPRL